ncbi:Acyl-CoA dehydrogenase [Celeribacter baekdonensis]|uniref:Acyl-CoA dehydrogenase n=1 Tax=Celeribacter baekdonensis TaxID=875171 RepID=A0A1G7R8Q2_9RHOB|nr:hypothetical protein [Celeribacter baekdonensis]SDG07054.1 Acyl-CoA dehydrogenase [Celeribacter baekdonensis]
MSAYKKDITQEIIAKVHAIGPILRDNAVETDKGRRVTQASLDALETTGVFGINSLAQNGGFEGGARMLLDVTSTIGMYCPSSAWISVISSVSAQLAMRFPDTAWNRVYAGGKPVRMASVIVNSGNTARREGEGYRINGEWPWGSNILNSEWAIGALDVYEAEGADPTPGYVLLHKDSFTIKDTWYSIGMRGTGSNNFIAKDILVPADQIASVGTILGPEFEMSGEAHFLQRLTPVSMFPTVIISGPLGGAKAALDYVIAAAGKRPITYSKYHPQNTSGAFVQSIGAAKAKIDTAEMSLQAAADLIDAAALGTEPLSMADRARVRNYGAHATANLCEVMNDLATLHGTATFAEFSPLGRLWRDVNTGARHAIAASPLCYEIGGASLLGVSPPTPLV